MHKMHNTHHESEANCKVLIMKITFPSYANKTNFHMNRFVFSLAFITRLTATRQVAYCRRKSILNERGYNDVTRGLVSRVFQPPS